ncbi:MAG: hypothetical protein A2787_06975 [Omnitrophica WOR_2 bacterium RIFCSPHIGHO2_01_FULL_48_9]|nr:MAG: hypothetical protein A2787_06975 [Omnitrophica WOR_2 bacterium RIFCSPHIGHO2_01_FULL_48_9]
MSKKLTKFLRLDPTEIETAKALRPRSIEEAVSLPGGPSRKEMLYHILWSGHGYDVGVGKPGKETERKTPNPYDMWPFIRKGDVFEEKSASFADIFHELEHMSNKSKYSLELLGCLLARSALMLDHQIDNEKVTYAPSAIVLDEIKKDIPSMFNVPLEVFLQYLEIIALNEDVKYQKNLNTKGKPYGKSAGRPNNLLTCAHLIAVLLGRTSIVDFAYGFAQQRGVSAISVARLPSFFPMLAIDK